MSAVRVDRAPDPAAAEIRIRHLGRSDYEPTWRRMQQFTAERDEHTVDEIWFTEHPPVFTMGMNAAPEHLLAPGDIEVVNVDRGGQVTYHGPGQLMIYPLVALRRAGLGVRDIVTALEQAVIALLADHGVSAICRKNAPGVYVEERKVASVGLRVRRGASFHGMALNIDMDLEPFQRINPCGYEGLEVTDLRRLGIKDSPEQLRDALQEHLLEALGMAHRKRVLASD